jgi:ferredoxin-type protein NapH
MTAQARTQAGLPRMAIWKALLLTLPVVLFASGGLMEQLMGGHAQLIGVIPALIVWVLLTVFFFRMLVTGKTHRYRSALFILLAFALPFYLIPGLFATFGTNALTDAMTYSGKAQFCPMTMPMVLLPAVLKGVVVFPGRLAMGATWFLLWAGVSLAIGRGWCSWGCFFGGWDEFFSRLRKKPVIKPVNRKWTFLPFAILLAIVLLSALTFHPIYCEWLCPFKLVSEYEAPTSLRTMVALGIFPVLFLGLVIALPLLTKKRIQCALFCPFGAMQSFFNKINIFEVRLDPAKCTGCQRCIRECPTFSLDESSLESGRALMSCTKCGQCVDACPQRAMSYHIKGTAVGIRPNVARLLYLYPAYILFSIVGGHIIVGGLARILMLMTTGSMI